MRSILQKIFVLLGIAFFATPAFAINSAHLSQGIGEMAIIVQAVSIVMGVSFFIGALFKFKRYGEMRTMMSHQQSILKPITMMLVGVCLLCMPAVTQTLLLAIWGYPNPLAYPQMINADATAMMRPIIQLMRLVGVLGIIRGLVLLTRAGGESAQPGTVGKAILHIVGGVMCINIFSVYNLIDDLFK